MDYSSDQNNGPLRDRCQISLQILSESINLNFLWNHQKTMDVFIISKGRSSRPEVFYKKGVLRNFTKFTGKHLRQSLFFNKVAGLGCF